MGELSAASFAILRQIVVGSRIIEEVPPELVGMKLVRAGTFTNMMNGYLKNVWVATKAGRLMIARTEAAASASDET